MSTCYKCGRELPEGQVECEPECGAVPQPTDEQVLRFLDAINRQRVPIDWDKVKTIEDLILIHKTLFLGVCVLRDTEAYETLKRFLKSETDGQ